MEMDVCWKEYFRDDARYADVINGIGCGGQQLVGGEAEAVRVGLPHTCS